MTSLGLMSMIENSIDKVLNTVKLKFYLQNVIEI